MRALLLAAGLGTRLRPVTDLLPKCLVPIRSVPLLDYWLDLLLSGHAIERVLINTSYRAEQVHAHVAASRWRDRIDVTHEPTLLGTGGTVRANLDYFGHDCFLVAHADNLTRFDLNAFIARHHARPAGCELTMMTFDTDAPHSCGIVELDDREVIQKFHEKVATPPGIRANAATYIFEPSIGPFMTTLDSPVLDLSLDVIPNFLGKLYSFHNADYHRDIGTLHSLRLAEYEFEAIPPLPACEGNHAQRGEGLSSPATLRGRGTARSVVEGASPRAV